MRRYPLVVAAALLIFSSASANAADDNTEHLSPNAQKILATLNTVGINNKDVRDFVANANANMDKNNSFALAGDSALGGQWSLRYDVSAAPSGKQFELRYAPADSKVNIVARTNAIQVMYRFNLQ